MTIIYHNRPAKDYPNPREIYELIAAALRLEGQPVKMTAALRKACRLGSRKACARLKLCDNKEQQDGKFADTGPGRERYYYR